MVLIILMENEETSHVLVKCYLNAYILLIPVYLLPEIIIYCYIKREYTRIIHYSHYQLTKTRYGSCF